MCYVLFSKNIKCDLFLARTGLLLDVEKMASQLESECDSTLRLLASGSDLGGVSCKQARSLLIRKLLGCKEMKVVLKC